MFVPIVTKHFYVETSWTDMYSPSINRSRIKFVKFVRKGLVERISFYVMNVFIQNPHDFTLFMFLLF